MVADIGRDLTIASTQDSDHYNSRQNSVSGGVGYTFGAGGFSGSINVSRDKMTSDYDSVQEQSGLFAGSGGLAAHEKAGGHLSDRHVGKSEAELFD